MLFCFLILNICLTITSPILWPPHEKSWLIGKDPDAGRDWGQEEKGTTEDEMAGWHHQLDGHEFGWIPGIGDGQGGLVSCDSWGLKESDMTEQLNWTELKEKNFIWQLWVKKYLCIVHFSDNRNLYIPFQNIEFLKCGYNSFFFSRLTVSMGKT